MKEVESVMKELQEEPSKLPIYHHYPNPDNPRKPNEKTFFFYRLSIDPDNEAYQQAEYQYYEEKYNIGSITQELPICVISAGRNNNDKTTINNYLRTLSRQNYSNYHIVYVDDMSDDGTPEKMEETLFY